MYLIDRMADRDRIVVIHTFDNTIDANIIKTKLDAYGVPCFLSSENLTMLTTPFLSGGVRLHIFEQDRDEVTRVLLKSVPLHDEDDLVQCPVCHSKKILSFNSERFEPATLVKFMLQLSKQHYCLECETEFDGKKL